MDALTGMGRGKSLLPFFPEGIVQIERRMPTPWESGEIKGGKIYLWQF